MVDDYASDRSYYLGSSHTALQRELDERVQYDVESVMTRLRVSSVDDRFVNQCMQSLQAQLAEDVEKLTFLAAQADSHSIDYLESEAFAEAEDLDSGYSTPFAQPMKSRRELQMYGPLVRHIARFPSPDVQGEEAFDRVFRRQSAALAPNQYHTPGFPKFTPDFSLLRDRSFSELPPAQQRRWCDRAGFIEVKPSNNQHAYPTVAGGPASSLLAQAADYARLHLSGRPFSVFSISLLIFGCGFCVCIFDRQGVLVSPRYHMWEDLDVFIRVVRSLTRVLDEHELGLDPSVSPAPQSMLPNGTEAYIVDPVGSDPRHWCTVHEPIWSSLSLFGRGTTVWRVREVNASGQLCGPEMIMETSLRSSDRDAESFVYHAIKGSHPGLAKYVVGADVTFPDNKYKRITAHALRGTTLGPNKLTSVLHRIVIETLGRPVWEYHSERELLEGFITALEAHQFLAEQKILHRDISAGNILLAEDLLRQESAGFLTDLDFARLESDIEVKITETVSPPRGYGAIPSHLHGPSTRTHTKFGSQRGGQITGTLQFLSRRLLEAMLSGKPTPPTTAEDDVESFLWVLVYAIYRRICFLDVGTPEEQQKLGRAFTKSFGGRTTEEILEARRVAIWSLTDAPLVIQHTSEPLRYLLRQYQFTMVLAAERSYGTPLTINVSQHSAAFTHQSLLHALRSVLDQLRERPELDRRSDGTS
ncbi:hypothetical protein C8Q73DRAFT_643700 [Cubamyces lactineus]|nr:hypothetical protein C8Q73DRAFT_643700 [Cubamyces lactineus]